MLKNTDFPTDERDLLRETAIFEREIPMLRSELAVKGLRVNSPCLGGLDPVARYNALKEHHGYLRASLAAMAGPTPAAPVTSQAAPAPRAASPDPAPAAPSGEEVKNWSTLCGQHIASQGPSTIRTLPGAGNGTAAGASALPQVFEVAAAPEAPGGEVAPLPAPATAPAPRAQQSMTEQCRAELASRRGPAKKAKITPERLRTMSFTEICEAARDNTDAPRTQDARYEAYRRSVEGQ